MSRFLADRLTDQLLARLSPDTAVDRAAEAIVICTVDEHGWPHPAMLSPLEVVARDASNIRLAMHMRSRSARNMTAHGKLTLILADEQAVFYVKGDVLRLNSSLRTSPELATFNMRVDSVLEDSAADDEQSRIVSGIRVERRNVDPATSRAILEELLE